MPIFTLLFPIFKMKTLGLKTVDLEMKVQGETGDGAYKGQSGQDAAVLDLP